MVIKVIKKDKTFISNQEILSEELANFIKTLQNCRNECKETAAILGELNGLIQKSK